VLGQVVVKPQGLRTAMRLLSRALATRDLVWSESASSHPPTGAEPSRLRPPSDPRSDAACISARWAWWFSQSHVVAVHDGEHRPHMAGIAAVCLGERLSDDLQDQLARGREQRLALRFGSLPGQRAAVVCGRANKAAMMSSGVRGRDVSDTR